MRIWRLIRILPFSWLINFNYVVRAYDLDKCPPPWQWKLRALAFCNVSHGKYSCLYDVIQHKYIESCSGKPDYVKPGKRYVIRGERDNENCIGSRYQPFKLWSNRSSECEFLKSDCNELGQVIANNGSTTKGRTCRCDYSKGFDFVTKPINVCYCIPSKEDCSCYQKKCLPGEFFTKDYACVSKVNPEVQDGECSPIIETRTPLFTIPSTSRPRTLKPTLPLDDSDQITESHKWPWFFVLLSIILTFTSILKTIFSETMPPIKYIELALLHNENKGSTDGKGHGINTPTEQNRLRKLISENRLFLLDEMDTQMMPTKLYEKTANRRFFSLPDSQSRRQKATIICNILEEDHPDMLEDFFKVLEEMDMSYALGTLKAYTQIFSYTHKNILQNTLEENCNHIVESLTKKELVVDMISVCKERQILQQVDAKCNYNNDKIINQIVNSVLNGDMHSILNFVYALFIVGEKQNAFKLLQMPAQ